MQEIVAERVADSEYIREVSQGKSHSNKMCSYSSKPGHSNCRCYYKHLKKALDIFREKQKDKIVELKYTVKNKNSRKNLGMSGLQNAWGFLT